MPDLLDPSEIMFTPFEPKTKNRYIMYIEGIPSYLIKTANRPTIAFETIELDHINVKRYIKGKGTYISNATFGDLDWANATDPVDITLTLRYDYAILQF